MIKTQLLVIAAAFMLSCGSNELPSDSDDTDAPTVKKNKKGGNFGEWEQDQEGNKYREDYELRDKLSGYELVKYTRINGGQFGGGSSTTTYTLCSDGSMKYYYQSSTTISVDGGGASDASQDEDYGTWKAIETETGYKVLMVKSSKSGGTGYMEFKLMDGSKIQIVRYNEWEEF